MESTTTESFTMSDSLKITGLLLGRIKILVLGHTASA